MLVVGAQNSSNSNRLREIGSELGLESYLIDDASCFNPKWLEKAKTIGVTAGASAPDILVDQLVSRLAEYGYKTVEILDGIEENISFNIPFELRHIKETRKQVG